MMSSSWSNKVEFLSLMDLAILDFSLHRRRMVSQNHLFGFANNWDLVYARNSHKIAFWIFSLRGRDERI